MQTGDVVGGVAAIAGVVVEVEFEFEFEFEPPPHEIMNPKMNKMIFYPLIFSEYSAPGCVNEKCFSIVNLCYILCQRC